MRMREGTSSTWHIGFSETLLERPEERSYFSRPSEADCEPVGCARCSLLLCLLLDQGILGSFAPEEGTGIPDVPDKDCEADVADTWEVLPASVSRSCG